ncbi:hypothetical protein [Bosea sp. (in: a-proteobacteria)]|uniref:hypothetical protein n=1 Tax=Bosea sp. (in: a-proteobacteria) TaxID=1871050 RepID=UPI00273410D9|nr:hypothetical protein [Bosea sp. (in: a-proteobacteria)]MDP3407261.1 hypothetical protein [Bosea sp. (in: a-proteobacteria)]
MANPMDDIEVQVPGRLLALEILVTLLLREKANSRKLLAEAERHLAKVEAEALTELSPETRERALQMFEAARTSFDVINRFVRA